MFGFFRRAFRPFASIGEKMGEIFNIGRKARIEQVIEGGRPFTHIEGGYLKPASQFNPETKGFYGGLSEIVN
jgi:hypothetical protein